MTIIQKIRSNVHINLPSVLGFISQLILACLWFEDYLEIDMGRRDKSFTLMEFFDYYSNEMLITTLVFIVIAFLATAPWAGRALTSKRRGELIIPLVFSYAQLGFLIHLNDLFTNNEEFEDFVEITGSGKAMIFFAILSIILCHLAYISLRNYQNSLKAGYQVMM